jgi:hypothetical protein
LRAHLNTNKIVKDAVQQKNAVQQIPHAEINTNSPPFRRSTQQKMKQIDHA